MDVIASGWLAEMGGSRGIEGLGHGLGEVDELGAENISLARYIMSVAIIKVQKGNRPSAAVT